MGVIAYRWDVNVGGLLISLSYLPNEITPLYHHYVPSLVETVAGLGVVAYGVLAITLAVKYLNLVDHSKSDHLEVEEVESGALPAAAD